MAGRRLWLAEEEIRNTTFTNFYKFVRVLWLAEKEIRLWNQIMRRIIIPQSRDYFKYVNGKILTWLLMCCAKQNVY